MTDPDLIRRCMEVVGIWREGDVDRRRQRGKIRIGRPSYIVGRHTQNRRSTLCWVSNSVRNCSIDQSDSFLIGHPHNQLADICQIVMWTAIKWHAVTPFYFYGSSHFRQFISLSLHIYQNRMERGLFLIDLCLRDGINSRFVCLHIFEEGDELIAQKLSVLGHLICNILLSRITASQVENRVKIDHHMVLQCEIDVVVSNQRCGGSRKRRHDADARRLRIRFVSPHRVKRLYCRPSSIECAFNRISLSLGILLSLVFFLSSGMIAALISSVVISWYLST